MVTKKSKKKAGKKVTSKRAKVKDDKTTKKPETTSLNDLPYKQIISYVTDEILSDDGNANKNSSRIQNTYRDANEVQRAIIDDIFMSLCGWSMKTIIERANPIEEEENEDWDDLEDDDTDTSIIRRHCDKLGLGEKDTITKDDLSNLVTSLTDNWPTLAIYIQKSIATPNALQDLLVNTIYGDEDE
jgi:hypothetical protein